MTSRTPRSSGLGWPDAAGGDVTAALGWPNHRHPQDVSRETTPSPARIASGAAVGRSAASAEGPEATGDGTVSRDTGPSSGEPREGATDAAPVVGGFDGPRVQAPVSRETLQEGAASAPSPATDAASSEGPSTTWPSHAPAERSPEAIDSGPSQDAGEPAPAPTVAPAEGPGRAEPHLAATAPSDEPDDADEPQGEGSDPVDGQRAQVLVSRETGLLPPLAVPEAPS